MKEYTRKLGLSHRTTPSFSQWANGLCERNHATVDRMVIKIRQDNPEITLQEAVDLGCFWKNQTILKTGFSSQQLMFGRGLILPGVLDGNVAVDSPAYTNDIAKIMDKHHKARLYHQQADTDSRIKKMLATRNKEYNEYHYEDGDDIFVKDKNKELWEGPVKVQHQEGNNVNIIKDGRVTSVPIQRTQPVKRKRILENITEEENDREEEAETEVEGDETTKNVTEEDDQEEEVTTSKPRPKRGEKITLKVNGKKLQGIVKSVGKKSGKDANRCWVKFKGEEVRSFDFKDEVDSWKKVHSVNFSENPNEKEEFIVPAENENNQEIRKKERNMEEKGIWTMYYTRNNLEILEDEQKLNKVLVTEAPRKYHESPEVRTGV